MRCGARIGQARFDISLPVGSAMTDTIEGRDEQALIHVNTANMPRPAIPGFGRNREFGTARRESGLRISDTIERMREAPRFVVSAPRQMPCYYRRQPVRSS